MASAADELAGIEPRKGDGGPRSERLRLMATIVLGMVVKGRDLERRDLTRLGYGERSVHRAFSSLRSARVLRKVTRKNYAFRDRVLAEVGVLAAEDVGRPAGWPSIHNFLFTAFGMFDWDEQKMDSFLSFVKKDWLHRMRGSQRPLAGPPEGDEATDGERTYTLREAAGMLGVTVRTIQMWSDIGKVRCVTRPGSAWRRVSESEMRRLLLGN